MPDIQKDTVQWFPGHMAKTRRKIKESLSLVDGVTELRDARIPLASTNPELNELIEDKPKIIQRMAIESDEGPTDSNGWNAGSYWRAYLTIDDANYIVTVRSLHDSNLTTIGEGVISSMDINKELKDEYEN